MIPVESRPPAGVGLPSPANGGPTVSVIIPLYNDQGTIRRCLDSILSQSRRPQEIIVVDDRSTDDSAGLVAKLPVTLVRRPRNGGAAAARADGAGKASGDIIAFLDADCIAPRDWLERIAEAFASDATLLGIGGGYTHGPGESLQGHATAIEEEFVHHVYSRYPEQVVPPGGNCAYRRTAWEQGRTSRELFHFARLASGEDSVVGHDIQQTGRVRFRADLAVEHVSRNTKGYFRRHFRRGLSRSTIIHHRLTTPHETMVVFEAFGGWPVFAGSLSLGAAVLAVAAVPLAPLIAGAAALLLAVTHSVLTASYFAFARACFGMWPEATRPTLRLRIGLRFLLLGRSLCWMAGAGVSTARYLGFRIRVWTNVVRSIVHFWVPGRISKLFFFVTSRCNARCAFCFNLENVVNWKERQPLELTVEEIRRIAKKLGRLPYLTLSGGEPFVRRDLPDVVHAFYRYSKTQWVTIPTNAALVNSTVNGTLEILNRCPGMFLTIQISIDSLYEDHDQSRVLKGGFARMTETLTRLGRIRRQYPTLRLQLATCYDDFNVYRMKEIIEYCRSHFEYDQHMFYLIRDSHTRITTRNNHLVDPFTKLVKENEAWEGRNHRRSLWTAAVRTLHGLTYRDLTRIKLRNEFLRPCAATQKFATLWDNGDVSPCEVLEFTRLGNIRDYDFNFYQLKRVRRINQLHRREIVAGRCNCDWACAPPINMLYDPNTYVNIVRGLLAQLSS